MNRQERRRAEREGVKVKTPVLVHEDKLRDKMLDIQDELVRDARIETIKIMQMAFIVALNNECGFGAKRINKVVRRTACQFECLAGGLISFADLEKMCKDIGVKI